MKTTRKHQSHAQRESPTGVTPERIGPVTKRAYHKFRLYIAGNVGNSALAIQNLNTICRAHLPGQYEIENVDVFKEPQRALADIVVMTPTLIKLSPKPMCRIVGTLSETKSVMSALGLTADIA